MHHLIELYPLSSPSKSARKLETLCVGFCAKRRLCCHNSSVKCGIPPDARVTEEKLLKLPEIRDLVKVSPPHVRWGLSNLFSSDLSYISLCEARVSHVLVPRSLVVGVKDVSAHAFVFRSSAKLFWYLDWISAVFDSSLWGSVSYAMGPPYLN